MVQFMATDSLLATLSERLQSSASVAAVFGEPVRMEGKTIIPVARIAYGFGGGEGSRGSGESPDAGKPGDYGGGGGGGVAASPVGVFEITAEQTIFIPMRSRVSRLLIVFAAGMLAGVSLARLNRG
jgi:uncharacterized spore protein YtfJ